MQTAMHSPLIGPRNTETHSMHHFSSGLFPFSIKKNLFYQNHLKGFNHIEIPTVAFNKVEHYVIYCCIIICCLTGLDQIGNMVE